MFYSSTILNQCTRKSIWKQIGAFKRYSKRRQQISKFDPGIRRRKDLLKQSELDDENIYDFEADFMALGMTHKEHIEEMEAWDEKQKYHIVKEKYFKQATPNFLTWNDKQQIRYLHNTYPEEWTIEKLSEGFPALPHVIMKIAKSTWIKEKDTKVKNHDESVQRNWTLFKQGKLSELPDELVEHLQKFTNRKLNYEAFSVNYGDVSNLKTSQPKKVANFRTEFSEIITSYQKLKNKCEERETDREETKQLLQKEMFTLSTSQQSRSVPLSVFKEQKMMETSRAEDGELVLRLNESEIKAENFTENKVEKITESKYASINSNTKKDYSHLIYPEKILISKDKWKRGHTYKLNDCFYDDDGLFLYRVPGMNK